MPNKADWLPIMVDLETHIINILKTNARTSNAEMARLIGVSEATIRRRLNRMLEDRSVEITVTSNPAMMGNHVDIVMALQVDQSETTFIANKIHSLPWVNNIYTTLGSIDIFVIASISSIEALPEYVRDDIAQIPGVNRVETFLATNIKNTLSPSYTSG